MDGTVNTSDEGRCCPRTEWDAVGDEDDLATTEDGAK